MKTSTLLGFLLVATFASAQHDGHWHFGNGISMDFTSGTVALGTSDIDVPLSNLPATISTMSGDLLYYTDGEVIHGPNGNLLPDGTLAGSASESLFIPMPGNLDQHYLVRSLNSGLEWVALDATLAVDGNLIDPTPTNFYTTECRLLATPKLDSDEFWLLALDNLFGSLNVHVFSVSATGIELEADYGYSFIWVDWFDALDDIALSPDCSRIAATFKGHYFALLDFDQETGVVTDPFAQSIDTGDGFSATTQIVFSPSGEYLYTSGNGSLLRQFDLTDYNATSIQNSMTTVTTTGSAVGVNWSDMKCGPDGILYVADSSGDKLDAILNPDDPTPTATLTTDYLSPEADFLHFPLIPNLTCASVVFSIQAGPACLGDLTDMTLSGTVPADSVNWEFGDPDNNTGTGDDVSFEYLDVGTYTVTATVEYGTDTYQVETTVEVNVYPTPDIGPDLEFCAGESAVLEAGTDAASFEWMNGSDDDQITVSETGWAWLIAANGACEVIDSAYVNVLPIPQVVCDSDVVLCDDGTATLAATSAQEISWSNGVDGDSFDTAVSGTYTATVSNACGTDSDDITLTVVSLPTDFLPATAQACFGDTLLLGPTVDVGQASTSWNTGSGDAVIEVNEAGDFVLTLEYLGCEVTDVTAVTLIDSYPIESLIMPNIFTPDQDQYNTSFRPFDPANPGVEICGIAAVEVDLDMFNRWGNLLLENGCAWDGTDPDGKDVIEGTYYFIVEVVSTCGTERETREFSGYVEVVR